jgi:predicted metal-binding protein
MMHKQSTIETLIEKEKDIINKYREFANAMGSQGAIILCEDLSNKHNVHISMLEKYLER